jgi:hypothetical protein
MRSHKRRIEALERQFAESSAGARTTSGPDPDNVAVLDELAALKGSMAVHYRGSKDGLLRIEPENIPQKILGDNYTVREFRELAISRALRKCGYSQAEVSERMPHYLERFEYFDVCISNAVD